MSLERIGTSRQVLSDVATKEERVRRFLERCGIDALVLGRQDNFAWITTGGDNRVVSTTQMGVGYVVIGKNHRWLVSYVMDGRRLVEEQVPGEEYELGYGEEWIYHFQGGITGYVLADPARCLDPEARAVERQAYDYFITITGAKYEECLLVMEDEPEAISIGDGWPTRDLETAHGKTEVADVLIR